MTLFAFWSLSFITRHVSCGYGDWIAPQNERQSERSSQSSEPHPARSAMKLSWLTRLVCKIILYKTGGGTTKVWFRVRHAPSSSRGLPSRRQATKGKHGESDVLQSICLYETAKSANRNTQKARYLDSDTFYLVPLPDTSSHT